LETVYRDYAPRGVKFYYIYKALAHPETNGYITPFTLEERLMHVKQARRTLGSEISWLCDTMDNGVKHALGDAPNSELVLDPDGRVVRKRAWSDPVELRKDLEQLVGLVDRVTGVADLNLPKPPARQRPASGVVPRLELPGPMRPLVVEPNLVKSSVPFYVKLRVEGQDSVVQRGVGKIYLGFFLDPLYAVHWNNRAGTIRWTIEAPDDLQVEPREGRGPVVEADADIDPREFLVSIEAPRRDVALTVKVTYVACDDDETFCVPVSQEYSVHLQRDRDGGARRSGAGSAAARGNPNGARPGGMAAVRRLFETLDRDGNREISAEEIRRAPESLRRLDRNGDGQLTPDELGQVRGN
jgi:hypothetical protein